MGCLTLKYGTDRLYRNVGNCQSTKFYVLLTVHLGSVLANNQLDAQFFFRMYLFIVLHLEHTFIWC